MKKWLLTSLCLSVLLFLSCESMNSSYNSSEELQQKKFVDSKMKYICPMSCIEGKNDSGHICNECGMNLVFNDNYKEE